MNSQSRYRSEQGEQQPYRTSSLMISRELAGSLASERLDLVRGLAALVVLWGHVRAILFVSGHELAGAGRLIKTVYFATSLGHQAVMIFFVLSGFLVSGSAIKACQQGRWSWRWYLTNRFTRLYVVLLPALLLGAVWDRLGMNLFGTAGIYGGHSGNFVVRSPVAASLTVKAFAGNALFLQTILVPNFGSNGALWSLANEFWYYIAFALCLTAVFVRSRTLKVGCIAATLLIGCGAGAQISLYFLIWLMGLAINFMPQVRHGRILLAAGVAMLMLSLVFTRSHSGPASDFLVGAASTALIYGLLQTRLSSAGGMFARISHRLANMSYTLYVVHLPLVVFISAWILNGRRWQPDLLHAAVALALIAAALVYAAIVASFTEARTPAIRAYVVHWLDAVSPVAQRAPGLTPARRLPAKAAHSQTGRAS